MMTYNILCVFLLHRSKCFSFTFKISLTNELFFFKCLLYPITFWNILMATRLVRRNNAGRHGELVEITELKADALSF